MSYFISDREPSGLRGAGAVRHLPVPQSRGHYTMNHRLLAAFAVLLVTAACGKEGSSVRCTESTRTGSAR